MLITKKSIKKYIEYGKVDPIEEPNSALNLSCRLGKSATASERALLMNFEPFKSELLQLTKQENTLLGQIQQFNKSFNLLLCDIIISIMKNIDIASTSSGLPRETYMISKRVMWLMRNYFWIVTWFYPKGGHGSTFMEANILKYGSKWNCQYNGVDQCVHRATVIQVGINQLLSDGDLYNTFIAMIRANADTHIVQQWLLSNLNTFIKKPKIEELVTQNDLSNKNDVGSNIGAEDLLENEIDIPEKTDDRMCIIKIQEYNSLDPILLEANPKMHKQYVNATRQYIWDTGTQLNMNTGSCGIAGGVDGSLSHIGNINIVSYIYEAVRGLAIDFGSGTGYTALLIAATTLYFVICVETNPQRYVQSLQNALRLLSTANGSTDSASVEGNKKYANVQFYYNGSADDLESFKEKHSPPDCLNFTSIPKESFPPITTSHPHLIALAYWFQHGWSPADRLAVVMLLNSFINLKYLCSDITLSELESMGFNFDIHKLHTTLAIDGRMAGSKSSRQFFVHIFVSEMQPIPEEYWQPTSTTALSGAVEYFNKFSFEDKKSRSVRNPVVKYTPEPFTSSNATKTSKSTAVTTKASSSVASKSAKPTTIVVKEKWPLDEYAVENYERIVFPAEITSLKLRLAYIKEMKNKKKQLVYEPLHQPEPSIAKPSVNEDMLVNKFSQVGLNDTETVSSVDTIGKIDLLRSLIDTDSFSSSTKEKKKLLDLLAAIQYDVYVHQTSKLNASGFGDRDETSTQVTGLSSALLTQRSIVSKFTQDKYMIKLNPTDAFTNLEKPNDDLNSSNVDGANDTHKKSKLSEREGDLNGNDSGLPDLKKGKTDNLAMETPGDMMIVDNAETELDDTIPLDLIKVKRPVDQSTNSNEKIDLTADDNDTDKLVVDLPNKKSKKKTGKKQQPMEEGDINIKPQPVENTFFQQGLFSSGHNKNLYRLHVSKEDINELSRSDKRLLEANPDMFLRSTKPMVSIMKLKTKHYTEQSGNTIGNGRCSVLFLLQVRDKEFKPTDKHSDDYEYFTEFVENFLMPRIKENDEAENIDTRSQLQRILNWLPFSSPGEFMPKLIENDNGDVIDMWFDASLYSNFDFPDHMRFSVFTAFDDLFNLIASKAEKRFGKQYLMLNYTNVYKLREPHLECGYVKATIDEIPALSNGLMGHYSSQHMYIIQQTWAADFLKQIDDECALMIGKVKSFIKSDGYCPAGYLFNRVLPGGRRLNYNADLPKLKPGQLLNDTIMASFVYRIREELYPNREVCCFDETNYLLDGSDSNNVDYYLRRFDRYKKDPKDKIYDTDQLKLIKHVVWTINSNLHWVFAVVSLLNWTCTVYDSCNSSGNVPEDIKDKVNDAFYLTIGAFNFVLPDMYPENMPQFLQPPIIINQPSYPQQVNGCDCGVFTLRGIAEFMKNPLTKFDFDQNDIHTYRDEMFMYYENWLIDD